MLLEDPGADGVVSAGDTWGISGPTFLAVYAGLLALTVALVVLDRRRHREASPAAPSDLDDYDLAVLNGEPALAVSVALLSLDRRGVVELGDRLVRELAQTHDIKAEALTEKSLAKHGLGMEVMLTGDLPAGAHAVERGVYATVVNSSSRRVKDIRTAAARMPALEEVRLRLVSLGLLLPPAELARRRRQGLWFFPLLLLGLVRLGAGVAAGRPVSFLVLLLVVTLGAMFVASFGLGERTARGNEVLAELRQAAREEKRESRPGPDGRPDPVAAAHLLALNGTAGLWALDRPLALAVGVSAGVSGGSSSCGSSGGSCGGGGGCGG